MIILQRCATAEVPVPEKAWHDKLNSIFVDLHGKCAPPQGHSIYEVHIGNLYSLSETTELSHALVNLYKLYHYLAAKATHRPVNKARNSR